MNYFDTSVLVSLLTREPLSPAVGKWFRDVPLESQAVSAWVIAEFSSALAVKVRIGVLDAVERGRALARFHRLRQGFQLLPIETMHFLAAAHMVDRARNLRATDALHLAVAGSAGATVWTLDEGMVKAANQLSLLAAIPPL